jgi:hypothetical protein
MLHGVGSLTGETLVIAPFLCAGRGRRPWNPYSRWQERHRALRKFDMTNNFASFE